MKIHGTTTYGRNSEEDEERVDEVGERGTENLGNLLMKMRS